MAEENRNVYLEQVVASQERLDQEMRAKRASSMDQPAQGYAAPVGRASRGLRVRAPQGPGGGGGGGGGDFHANAVDVRITGWGRWQTVVVPPNAFVVHTRRGHTEPLHVGLGMSFRFNPRTDSFLVVPGAMPVAQAHEICDRIEAKLREVVDEATITIHVEPEEKAKHTGIVVV